jgi:EmrB/QacA subfamily drug resistance transporter
MSRSTVLALVAMGIAVLVIANDFTALSVALPAIEKQFDTDVSTVQWVINAYALTFGVLIVVGGRLADMFGRKRTFIVGSAIFATFSLLGGVSQETWWLLAARTLMGIGGALMWPAILGMTYAVLPDDKAGLAGGIIIGAAGFGNAVGPLIGGFLTDTLSWRWIFYVNVPIAAFGVLATWWAIHVAEPEAEDRRIDYAGVATLSVGLVALLVALDQVTDWGWGSPRIIGLFAICAVLLVAFTAIERGRGMGALVPREILRSRDFSAAALAVLLMSAIFFAALLYLPQFMQKILDYTPVEAGVGLLPMMGVFALSSFVAGPLYERLGGKLIVTLGAAAITVGMFLLSRLGQNAGYGALVPGMVALGMGIGIFYSSVTTAAITALDPARASLAGGIVYMCQIAGGSIGLGLNTTLFSGRADGNLDSHIAALGTRITDTQADLAHGILAGTKSGQAVLAQVGPAVGDQLTTLVRHAFVTGVNTAFTLDAALAAAALVISLALVGGKLHGPHGPRPGPHHHRLLHSRAE